MPFERFRALSARELAGLVARREVSPVALIEACLERLDAMEPDLNAFVHLAREEPLAAASAAEAAVIAGGRM